MKKGRSVAVSILWMLLGITLMGLGVMEILDAFWSGMGSALLVVGVLRLVRTYRFQKDDTYREKVETEIADERNKFIRNKAWAWAGYLFILIIIVSYMVINIQIILI